MALPVLPPTQGAHVARAHKLLEDARGVVRIEDMLPLFPDFVQIDRFKDAICASLGKYNREIEDLRKEMQLATTTAQAIR